MGLDLSAEDIAALEARTEGWIASLQLAALALQGLAQQGTGSVPGHRDARGSIRSFTGSHHFVLDYLMEEVLHQQPQSVQDFLLQTSILNRLTGAICDAVRFGLAESPSTAAADAVCFGLAETQSTPMRPGVPGQQSGQATLEMLGGVSSCGCRR